MVWQSDRPGAHGQGLGFRSDGDFSAGRGARRHATPEIERAQVAATVKWFNAQKGFGFVTPVEGEADAFLHISVLERSGYRELEDGATVVCDLGRGERGPQVVNIHEVDTSTAQPRRRAPRPMAGPPVEGTVKFFSLNKGFGFVTLDEGGKDVFVHARVLERSGLNSLESDQRVRLTVSMGQKGPQASSIALI